LRESAGRQRAQHHQRQRGNSGSRSHRASSRGLPSNSSAPCPAERAMGGRLRTFSGPHACITGSNCRASQDIHLQGSRQLPPEGRARRREKIPDPGVKTGRQALGASAGASRRHSPNPLCRGELACPKGSTLHRDGRHRANKPVRAAKLTTIDAIEGDPNGGNQNPMEDQTR